MILPVSPMLEASGHLGRASIGLVLVVLVATGCAGSRRPPGSPPSPAAATPQTTVEGEDAPEPEIPEGIFHVVQRGQTLWRIARAYRVPLEKLAEANRLADPSRLETGQVLFVPGVRETLDVLPFPAPLPSPGENPTDPREYQDTGFTWPIEGATVLSYYGAPRRTHRHQGLDLRGRKGQDVLAARAGRVIYSGNTMRGYGKTVILDHGGGIQTLYAHNNVLLVKVGRRVERGEPIARVGKTGNATTEHCHFEIRRNRVPVDPLLYLPGVAEGRP
jgi:murein DD-endopeptidase MepM/ murein hydrolase activator NlpD